MFGFLKGSRPSSRANSRASSPAPRGVKLQINVPSYGGVFMTGMGAEGDADADAEDGAQFLDRELSGELEIDVPRGMGRRRCRAIRLTLKNVARLNMGDGRGWEEDVLFERTLEMKGAIILEEGLQRFNFTIVVPFALACYDVHPKGSIHTDLIAEVEGLTNRSRPVMSASSSTVPSPAATPRRGRSPVRQASALPSGSSSPHLSSGSGGETTPLHEEPSDGMTAPVGIIATQMLVSWSDPISSTTEGEVKWLKGVVTAQRMITLLYNPEPSNGVSTLDERRRGEVQGLGPFDVRYMSDVWTVCALMKLAINIPEPAPTASIYYIRVFLRQTYAITSPRDDPETAEPVVTTTPFVVFEKGIRPPPNRPTRGMPALWRGKEAEGADSGGVHISSVGRLPNDETGRPSTLAGVITPIKVTHQLVMEVWYSIFGEDVGGNPLPEGGQSQLRVLRVDKPVTVPSCAFIPEVVELPSYESHKFDTEPCPLCHTPPEEQACHACPPSSVPHARHDLDPALVGNVNGICPRCEKRFITDDVTGKWADCACGKSLRQLEERMRSATLDDNAPPVPAAAPNGKMERGRTSEPVRGRTEGSGAGDAV